MHFTFNMGIYRVLKIGGRENCSLEVIKSPNSTFIVIIWSKDKLRIVFIMFTEIFWIFLVFSQRKSVFFH